MGSTYTLQSSDSKSNKKIQLEKQLPGTARVNLRKGEIYKRLNAKNFWDEKQMPKKKISKKKKLKLLNNVKKIFTNNNVIEL